MPASKYMSCFPKQRVRSKLTNNSVGNNVTSVDEYSKIVTAQQLGDRIMHIMHISRLKSGAIIRDGDRKSWDARGPMIWDNFSIFRTNCAILTSYICADPRTCRGLSRGCYHVVLRVARLSCRFFIAMAGNKAEKKNQTSSMYFNALI